MREAISNSLIFMIVISIVGVCSIIIISSLAYSKTFKIKNRMVEIIEKYQEYDGTTEKEINTFLKNAGYPTITSTKVKCPKGRGNDLTSQGIDPADSGLVAINTIKNYKYCIYKYKTVKGHYFSVVAYMTAEFPLLGDLIKLEFPVYGDTRVFQTF